MKVGGRGGLEEDGGWRRGGLEEDEGWRKEDWKRIKDGGRG